MPTNYLHQLELHLLKGLPLKIVFHVVAETGALPKAVVLVKKKGNYAQLNVIQGITAQIVTDIVI